MLPADFELRKLNLLFLKSGTMAGSPTIILTISNIFRYKFQSKFMIPSEFSQALKGASQPIVLLEGTRTLLRDSEPRVEAFAAQLARRFPDVIFRSGNAPGSDQAFARGVAAVDVSRLEIVVPYARHRWNERPPGARILSLDDIEDDEELGRLTLAASPIYKNLFASRAINASAAKVKYLLRDTLKITGTRDNNFAPATAGLFWVNPFKPKTGGTAHTIRVCQQAGLPLWTQDKWENWFGA